MEAQQGRLHNRPQLQNPQNGGRLVKNTPAINRANKQVSETNSCQVFFIPLFEAPEVKQNKKTASACHCVMRQRRVLVNADKTSKISLK